MKTISFFLFFVCLCYAEKPLPSYIQACSKNDPNLNECFAEKANFAIPLIAQGDSEYGFPSFMPLKWQNLLKFNVPGIELSFTNVEAMGAENFKVEEPNIDLDNRIIQFNFTAPLIIWAGDYKASVGVSVIKKSRSGQVEFHFKNGKFLMTYHYDLETIDGKQYMKIVKAQEKVLAVDIDVKTDENNLLGMQSQEWILLKPQLLTNDMLDICANTIGEFFTKIFSVVPYDQIFTE